MPLTFWRCDCAHEGDEQGRQDKRNHDGAEGISVGESGGFAVDYVPELFEGGGVARRRRQSVTLRLAVESRRDVGVAPWVKSRGRSTPTAAFLYGALGFSGAGPARRGAPGPRQSRPSCLNPITPALCSARQECHPCS